MKQHLYIIVFLFLLTHAFSEAKRITYPEPRKFKLSNGLNVALLEDKNLPYISFYLLIPYGSSSDPDSLKGLNYTVSEMLQQGTFRYQKKELLQKLENLGSSIQTYHTKDYLLISASTLSWYHDDLLELLTEVIARPALTEASLKWVKKQSLSRIQNLPDSASSFANALLSQVLFQNQGYSHHFWGYKKSIQSIQINDVKTYYKKYFIPNYATLGVAGRYPSNIKQKLEKYFSTWEKVKKPVKRVKNKVIPNSLDDSLTKPSFLVVHRKGQFQSEIRLGNQTLHRSSKDYLPLKIANIVLGGGGLDTRLFEEIREKHGLTYHVSSSINAYQSEGILSIRSPVRLSVTREALDRMIDVVEKLYKEGITKQEFEKAKKHYKIQILQNSETTEQQLLRYMVLNFYQIKYDLPSLSRDLLRLKRSRVHKVIQQYFHPSHLTLMIYSDFDQIKSQLSDMKSIQVKKFDQFL